MRKLKSVLGSLIIAVIAIMAAIDATVSFARRVNPAVTLSFYPNDPVALSLQSEKVILGGTEAKNIDKLGHYARIAIQRQPLNAAALSQLGLSYANQNGTRAGVLMNVAFKMSRRDILTQLWYIEKSKSEGKIAAALSYYDIGMRTLSSSTSYFFPILTADLGAPEFRLVFLPYIKSNPDWVSPFLSFASANTGDPSNIASMIEEGGGLPKDKSFRAIEGALLAQLVSKSDPAAVKKFYLSLKQNASKNVLTSLEFNKISTDVNRNPVTWSTVQSAKGESVFFDDASHKNLYLRAAVLSGEREIVARKLMFLTPGNYAPSLKIDQSKIAQGALVSLDIYCVEAGKYQLLQHRESGLSSGSQVRISANCKAQNFDISLYGGDNQNGAEVVIHSVSMKLISG